MAAVSRATASSVSTRPVFPSMTIWAGTWSRSRPLQTASSRTSLAAWRPGPSSNSSRAGTMPAISMDAMATASSFPWPTAGLSTPSSIPRARATRFRRPRSRRVPPPMQHSGRRTGRHWPRLSAAAMAGPPLLLRPSRLAARATA
ncbi:hypothetical protein [Lysobacter gummosus]|uniref:hypothetical protein n=1 Tax=Lysobacter gummosus TaxID=262324 RepID=UPI00362964AD